MRGWIVADEHRRETDASQLGHVTSDLGTYVRGEGAAVEDARCHGSGL
jgi:hypothetical protein